MSLSLNLLIVIFAILTGLLFVSEWSDHPITSDIVIIDSSPFLEAELQRYKSVIGDDFNGYRGHLFRVYSYTMHFLEAENVEKFKNVIEIALVYHDIALWTHSRFDYIDPSAELAMHEFKNVFNKEELKLMEDLICFHHKFTDYVGPHDKIVNAFRKADWIDASFGILKKGISAKNVRAVMGAIPEEGFHATLAGFGPKLRGLNIPKIVVELSSIFRF